MDGKGFITWIRLGEREYLVNSCLQQCQYLMYYHDMMFQAMV